MRFVRFGALAGWVVDPGGDLAFGCEGRQNRVDRVMAEISGDGGGFLAAAEVSNGQPTPTPMPTPNPTPFTVSGSFKEGKGSSRRRTSVRPSMDADDFFNLLHGSDPVKVELNRLENEVRGAKCGSIWCFLGGF